MKAQAQIDLTTKSIISAIETQIKDLAEDNELSMDCKNLAIFELKKTIDGIKQSWGFPAA